MVRFNSLVGSNKENTRNNQCALSSEYCIIYTCLPTLAHVYVFYSPQIMISTLQPVVRHHLGAHVPNVYDISRNVSFILQNGHSTVSYPRPLLPNVAEIACIHCKPAKPLPRVSISIVVYCVAQAVAL